MAWETFPYSYTSPYIHSWIFETLWVIIFWVWVLTHPTPPPTWHTPPCPTPSPFMTHPPHPTPGTFLGTKGPFFMGCFTMSPFGRQLNFIDGATKTSMQISLKRIQIDSMGFISMTLFGCPWTRKSKVKSTWYTEDHSFNSKHLNYKLATPHTTAVGFSWRHEYAYCKRHW